MGTRSLVKFKDGNKTLINIYRQYDGYIKGMGFDLLKILNNGQINIVNGYSLGMQCPREFNGVGCLAAYVLSQLKEGIGNVYLMPTGPGDYGQEYEYIFSIKEIGLNKNVLHLKIKDIWSKKTLFNGSIMEFSKYCKNLREAV